MPENKTISHDRRCGSCGRGMEKAKRIFEGVAFCSSCYLRHFERRPCERCGQPARLHKSQEIGRCGKCERETRRCLRCDELTPRAALIFEGEAVCKKCRRYYPPFPPKAQKDSSQRNCQVCRKPRNVAGRDPDGRPLCAKCFSIDRREEVAEEDRRYWVTSLARRQVVGRQSLITQWCRALFDTFVEFRLTNTPPKSLSLKLANYIQFFQGLETRFHSRKTLFNANLLDHYTPDELRRSEPIITFFAEIGVDAPTRAHTRAAAERRRIHDILAEHAGGSFYAILKAYSEDMANPTPPRQTIALTTQRTNLRAAAGLVAATGGKRITQSTVTRFLVSSPGQRASLSRFIGFLNDGAYDLSLPSVKSRNPRPTRATDSSLEVCLHALENEASLSRRRALLCAIFSGLLGLPLAKVVAFERDRLSSNHANAVTLYLDGAWVSLPDRLHGPLSRHLNDRDVEMESRQGWLFPGRPDSQPITSETVNYHLKKFGVTASQLAIEGRYVLKMRATENTKKQ